MANVIVAMFAVALIMGAVLVLASASLSSADRILLSWNSMVHRDGDKERTELTLIAADLMATSTNVDISIRNTGQTALRNFPRWDVIIQYYATSSNQGLNVSWLPYTSSTPSSGQWTVRGVYLDAGTGDPEVYEPGVFNSGEEIIVRLNITPAIPVNTDNLATIGAPNGVAVAAPFSR